MQALRVPATVAQHHNVLQLAAGYFKDILHAEDKQDLQRVLDDYRRHLVPRVVPLTLLNHHIERQRIEYLQNQIYFHPHPVELMLRNHV